MSEVDVEKLQAFQKRYNDLIGEGIVEGLVSPATPIKLPGLGISAGGGNYDQDGGPYTQNTGGTHTQTGGGGYTQSAPPKIA
jgi:hypothetical protein